MDIVLDRLEYIIRVGFGSQRAFAKAVGVHESTVSKWLKGERSVDESLLDAVQDLGINPKYLTGESDNLMEPWLTARVNSRGGKVDLSELMKQLEKRLGAGQSTTLAGKQRRESDSPGNELKRVVTRGSAVVPYYRHVIKAGNGAHVLTDEVEEFDVEAHYANTCVYEVGGDSMIDADIQEGDRLVVKLGHRFPNNSIILCRYNGDLMVKGARIQDGVIWLIPANEKMHPWACKESDQFEAIGVVIEVIRKPDTAAIKRIKFEK